MTNDKKKILAAVVAILGCGALTLALLQFLPEAQPSIPSIKAAEALPAETKNIVTVVGSNRIYGDGGPATAAALAFPNQTVFDASGNLFIADPTNNAVRKVGTDGIITTVAGIGSPGFNGDNKPATEANLYLPRGLAVDASGNLYVVNQLNDVVFKIDANGIMTRFAGTMSYGYNGDNQPATTAMINTSYYLSLDPSGDLYISEFGGNRIRKVDLTTGIITTVVGSGGRCSNNAQCSRNEDCATGGTCSGGFGGDNGPATTARLNGPRGMAFDASGNLYFADSNNHRIRKVNKDTGVITTVVGNGTAGFAGDGGPATAARLNFPFGPAFDLSGNLYVSDQTNNRIRKVNATTGLITTFAGTGTACTVSPCGDGGLATAALLGGPRGLDVHSGSLYISDGSAGNGRIRRVNLADNRIDTVAGGGPIPSDDGLLPTAARVFCPNFSKFDSSGNFFFTELNGQRVRKVDEATGLLMTVAGTGVAGFAGDGGPATAAKVNTPAGLGVDASGNLYFSDFNNHRVRKIDADGIITTIVNTAGTAGFSGDGGPAKSAKVNGPRGMAFDASGDLFISEHFGNRIRKITARRDVNDQPLPFDGTETITTFAGSGGRCSNNAVQCNVNADCGTGNTCLAGFGGDGGPATAARLNNPRGMSFDSSGNLYFAEVLNYRVRKVDTNGIITTVAGTGVPGFSGDGGPATSAQLFNPFVASIDPSGDLLISDSAGTRLRKVDLATGIITTVAGTGVLGFSGDGGPMAAAQFADFGPMDFDQSGNLFIGDCGSNRVRRINVSAVVNVDPDTLNIASSNGKWVTAYVQFSEGRDASGVDLGSVRLQAIDPANGALRNVNGQVLQVARAAGSPKGYIDTNDDDVPDQLMVKFDRATAASWAVGADELVLRVEGKFDSGLYFTGDTSVRTIAPPMGGESAASSLWKFNGEACDPEFGGSCCEDPAYVEANPETCPEPQPIE